MNISNITHFKALGEDERIYCINLNVINRFAYDALKLEPEEEATIELGYISALLKYYENENGKNFKNLNILLSTQYGRDFFLVVLRLSTLEKSFRTFGLDDKFLHEYKNLIEEYQKMINNNEALIHMATNKRKVEKGRSLTKSC